jgi:hypothetical protein
LQAEKQQQIPLSSPHHAQKRRVARTPVASRAAQARRRKKRVTPFGMTIFAWVHETVVRNPG